jgi:hypothetical protein
MTLDPPVGLCGTCRHVRPITSARGSTFWLCGLSASDARFPRYPRLPVLRCPGYAARDDTPAPASEHPRA